jgi:hypothetical protein
MKVKDLAVMIIIAIIITILWRASEISIYGEVKPNTVDTVVAGILTASLFNNYKLVANQFKFNKKHEYISECEVFKKYSCKLEREISNLRMELALERANQREKAFLKAYHEVTEKYES